MSNLDTPHAIEIVGYRDLTGHETQSFGLPGGRGVHRGDLHQRLARLGDHERFALGGLFDEPGQMCLGLTLRSN